MTASNSTTIQGRLPVPDTLAERGFTPDQWRVLADVTFPTAKSPESILMAIDYCRARNLDIFKKPIHIVPMWSAAKKGYVETIWPGINEIQITAARTGAWAGMDPPKWGPDVTRTFTGTRRDGGRVNVEVTFPEWCEVTVHRMVGGHPRAFCEPVYWLEAYSTTGGRDSELPTDMWVKRPRGQLHKVAKAASLRAAFPEEGEYTAEEMEGKEIEAGGVAIDGAATATRLTAVAVTNLRLAMKAALAKCEDVDDVGALWAENAQRIKEVRQVDEGVYEEIIDEFKARKSALAEDPMPANDEEPRHPHLIDVPPDPKTGKPWWGAFVETVADEIKRIPTADDAVKFEDMHEEKLAQLAAFEFPVMKGRNGNDVSGQQAAKGLRKMIRDRIAELTPAQAAE